MKDTISAGDRVVLETGRYLLFVAAPGILIAFVVLSVVSQTFRERMFGPDYYDRSTPAYHGQWSRWDHFFRIN